LDGVYILGALIQRSEMDWITFTEVVALDMDLEHYKNKYGGA